MGLNFCNTLDTSKGTQSTGDGSGGSNSGTKSDGELSLPHKNRNNHPNNFSPLQNVSQKILQKAFAQCAMQWNQTWSCILLKQAYISHTSMSEPSYWNKLYLFYLLSTLLSQSFCDYQRRSNVFLFLRFQYYSVISCLHMFLL